MLAARRGADLIRRLMASHDVVVTIEEGAIGGMGLWRPAALGFRPTYESAAMKLYLQGGFVHLT